MGVSQGGNRAGSDRNALVLDRGPVGETRPRPHWLARLSVGLMVTGMGATALLYLVMPNAGVVELIPDAFPFVGNLDEAGATALLLLACSYWGFDATAAGRWLSAWSAGRRPALPPGKDEP